MSSSATFRVPHHRLAACLTALWWLTCTAAGAAAAAESNSVRRISTALDQLYAKQAGPLWTPAQASALAAVMAVSAEDGLNPGEYALPPGAEGADADRALTRRLLRYLVDLRSGRRGLHTVDPELFVHPPEPDLAGLVSGAHSATSIETYLASLRPGNRPYLALRGQLARLRAVESAGGWPAIPAGEVLKPGMEDPRAIALRVRLGLEPAPADQARIYDAALQDALRRFQLRHGLEDDAVIGAETLAALNVTTSQRITQVLVNLERWRWMPDSLGARHVFVNLAGFDLEAVANGETQLEMRVVVGRSYRRSPSFSNAIRYLELNPTWTVPPTIARKDMLPKLRADVTVLARDGFKVFSTRSDEQVDPVEVDWVSARAGEYRFVQTPGPKNALGRIKFMFPNPHHVYLHDTPSQEYFARRVRTFSSGCIRVEQPIKLAAWLLGVEGWDEARINAAIATARTSTVRLATPVPVHLVYATAWVDRAGELQIRPDIYGRDALLAPLLIAALTEPAEQALGRNASQRHVVALR